MKYLYITLFFVLFNTAVNAQNKSTKTADHYFDKYEFVDAAKEYLKLVDKGQPDLYIENRLADCYYNIFNTKEAVVWFAKVVDKSNDAETYYKYSQMLKAEGQYAESDKQMSKFASLKPDDQRAKSFKNNPTYLTTLKKQSKLFAVEPLNINSDKVDFGPVLSNDDILYFASSRHDSKTKSGWNDEPYSDIYKSVYKDGILSEPTLISELNTKWNDGPVAITSDGTTIYFASESFNEGDFVKNKAKKLNYGKIYLYKATKEGDTWKNIESLPFNNKAYSVRNPAISKDGKTLYFSSDMPGGFGGEDLWKISVGDSYGQPENLGSTINTEGNESFPYVTDDNVLYFASNGKQGLGGYDVYQTDMNAGGKVVTNLGEPVNTSKDDFSFSYSKGKKVGFFSSNRSGNDDLYKALPICGADVFVVVKNAKTGAFLEGATITALDEKDIFQENAITGAEGSKSFNLLCNTSYGFKASKGGYEVAAASLKSKEGKQTIELLLEPIQPIVTTTEVILQPIYFEFDKSNITAEGASELNKLLDVMNTNPSMVIFVKSHTDSRGGANYNLNLSERRAQSTVQYMISKGISKNRISGQGFGENEPKVICTHCSEEDYALNRRSEFLIVKQSN